MRGEVRARADGESLAFRGIPYAAAPVGRFRFAAPVPHPGWRGVRAALRNGPTPTLGPNGDGHSIPEPVVPGEEILNLNVFTPTLAARLPVYVWVHGGSYVGGSPGGPWFDGAAFNKSGVVVVTITYRLGFEGYGELPGAPSNRALRDMVAALTWVQQNIAAFGGDPDRVTLGGQSAGGGAVLALLAAPQARGLFHAAVCHSAPLPDIDPATAERIGREFAHACGIEHALEGWREVPREQIVAAERGLDAADLFSAVGDLYRILSAREPVTAFGPVLDGDFLPSSGAATFRAGSGVPLLMGATSHEFNRLTQPLARFLARGVSAAVLMGMGVPAPLARAYPHAHPHMSPAELLGQAITDRVFRIPAVQVAHERAAATETAPGTHAPTWLWDFRWRSPVTDRAVHCLDLPFAWHTLGADRVCRLAGDDPPTALADEMHTAIASFVRTHRAHWPAFSPDAPVAQVWDRESWTGRDPFRFERIAARVLAQV
ncbi:carboxylesterase/lipase family protein [Ruania halotolerans]|uniref:carboxylesterase/lipase family protein n=1 Tax=Ruania halotolerans TaxID=2897773 RepID=UPI001E499310|nr:carboxylesterase family protein [Ruania halotolerans]UFU05712.1 carboxylesterase family protein [Ruania halotolerans]